MLFKITRASDKEPPCLEATRYKGDYYIDIKKLSDLTAFIKKYGKIIIIPDNEIMIYDDWVE